MNKRNVAIYGLDGSGKSTVSEFLVSELDGYKKSNAIITPKEGNLAFTSAKEKLNDPNLPINAAFLDLVESAEYDVVNYKYLGPTVQDDDTAVKLFSFLAGTGEGGHLMKRLIRNITDRRELMKDDFDFYFLDADLGLVQERLRKRKEYGTISKIDKVYLERFDMLQGAYSEYKSITKDILGGRIIDVAKPSGLIKRPDELGQEIIKLSNLQNFVKANALERRTESA